MSDVYERHMERRISEMRERIRNSRSKKKMEMRTFRQSAESRGKISMK